MPTETPARPPTLSPKAGRGGKSTLSPNWGRGNTAAAGNIFSEFPNQDASPPSEYLLARDVRPPAGRFNQVRKCGAILKNDLRRSSGVEGFKAINVLSLEHILHMGACFPAAVLAISLKKKAAALPVESD